MCARTCAHCRRMYACPRRRRKHERECAANPFRRVYTCDVCPGVVHFTRRGARVHKTGQKHKARVARALVAGVGMNTVVPLAATLATLPFPAGKFDVILVDPPWKYRNTASAGAAEEQYRIMSIDELAALPVKELAHEEGSALFMWSTAPQMSTAIELITKWGFNYKTIFANWVKTSSSGARVMRPGNYSRPSSEFLAMAVRGRRAFARLRGSEGDRNISQLLVVPVTQHSKKHDEQYDLIERFLKEEMRGNATRKVELFARRHREGWEAWGDEVVG